MQKNSGSLVHHVARWRMVTGCVARPLARLVCYDSLYAQSVQPVLFPAGLNKV